MASATVSLKLLVDTENHRVLFAEASKDFVDFLFYILSLPLGTVVKLLRKEGMVGSLENLHQSIESLNDDYFQPHITKDRVLLPQIPNTGANPTLLLLSGEQIGASRRVYGCPNSNSYGRSFNSSPIGDVVLGNSCRLSKKIKSKKMEGNSCPNSGSCDIYVADMGGAICPNCRNSMTREVKYVSATGVGSNKLASSTARGEGGYVKGVITYMVMDNLVITPISSISSITLLNKLNIPNLGSLSEQVVEVGVDKAVAILKASLQSQTVLTNVFLAEKTT